MPGDTQKVPNTTSLFRNSGQLLDALAVDDDRDFIFAEHIHPGEGDGFVLLQYEKSFVFSHYQYSHNVLYYLYRISLISN